MGPKSKVEWSVLGAVTVVAVALIVMQLIHNEWAVDGYVLGLIGIGALPWFWRVLKKVEIPGGGSIELREQVERQQHEIDAMRFVMAHFLPDTEQRVLDKFAASESYSMGSAAGQEFFNASGPLRGLGFIEPIRENWNEDFNKGEKDLKLLFRLTDSGREYLKLRHQSKAPAA